MMKLHRFRRLLLVLIVLVFSSIPGIVAAQRYVDNFDGTVTDTETGLMWQQSDNGTTQTWDQALSYCNRLVLPSPGGHSDWRVPRIDELETIINYAVYGPTSFDPPFVTRLYHYWSSSMYVRDPDYAWDVYFYGGPVHATNKTDFPNYVRCVRGGPFWPFDPSDHLETPIGKPGTVLDTYWGYMWQKGDSGARKLIWDEAKDYCDGLNLDGYSDWRLPEIETLVTIVDYTHYDPALSPIFDPRSVTDLSYWSSSTYAYDSDYAWKVYFNGGDVYFDTKTDDWYIYGGYVRCVRGGPGFVPLTINKSGSGAGRITSSPQGIDCDTDCTQQSASFLQGTKVTLTANPTLGSIFQSWSGEGCSGTGQCVVIVDGDLTVTAEFALLTYTIVATAGEHGTITPSGAVPVNHDADQTFTIAPATNYHVADVLVDGTSVGAVNSYKFTNVTANRTISATFAIDTHMITATAGEHGTITPSGAVPVNHGADQTFTIAPATNYHVADVLVDGTSVGAVNSYKFTNVTANRTISATFAIDTHMITATKSGAGEGRVSSSPAGIDCGSKCSEQYDHGTKVTLTATTTPGSIFTGWSGVDCLGTEPCVITLNGDTKVTAQFDLLPALTVSKSAKGKGRITSSPSGIDCNSDCPSQTASFPRGTQVTLFAKADSGFIFKGWNGGGCSGTEPCLFTMGVDPVTVTAQFDRQAAVPTFSQWGMIIFAILMASSAFWVIRRRQQS
jgi:hypothetical protein